ncbi:AraC family transcriptional regulator [Conexibacter sp. CPCC 206217]|uniref:AraC family transcriptional regulator n=1 Tax=Conexibacter sp. CPCC 206217 TaxID=3064574 RepID=UPI0027235631|nr:AraC family transcriptional regulator [Conexibacter sp. CPCC 206217]MDO8211607.1 AraC family transcriptional regulator [Conexibacter sp. CPCC 206217]
MSADPLSDALALVDARCVISGGFSVGGAWALRFRPQARLKLSAVVRGSCWLTADGVAQPLLLEEGDVVVVNDRSSVVLAGDLSVEPTESAELFADSPGAVAHIGDGQEVVVIGGHVELDRGGEELLLTALAPIGHIRASTAEAPVLRALLDRLVHEMSTDRPGAAFATQQLAQLLFVEILRACVDGADALPASWLRALADDRLAPALRLMHGDPGRRWHLDELARSSAMSRTTFATRFRAVAGMPPLTYLHHWRMRIAERTLHDDDTSIAALAHALGYSSESAFSNAFKRTNGLAPRRFRDAVRRLDSANAP